MKIGLLGGSFNPPHQGHIHISELAFEKINCDQIWWIPTAKNPFKEGIIYENYENRLKKCQNLTKNYKNIQIKAFDEIYTEELIKKLQNQYSDIDFIWIMGADNFEKLHQWKNFKKLIMMIPFAVFSRGDFLKNIEKTEAFSLFYAKKDNKLPKLMMFDTKNLDVSSTKIRQND